MTWLQYDTNPRHATRVGENFSYKEAMELPGMVAAYIGSAVLALVYVVLSLRFLRPLVMRVLPAPGQGPSRKQQVEGFWCAPSSPWLI